MAQEHNIDEQNEVSTAPDYQWYSTELAKIAEVGDVAESVEMIGPSTIAELAKISEALFARRPENDVDFKLDRVYEVLHLLGNPHECIECVHIAGTNGKSSTTLMTERLLRYAGLKTGCFTSPHIINVTERILIDGCEVEAEVFIDAYKKVISATEQIERTRPELGKLGFFEVITIIAFYIFASLELDVCVVEVGLGGLLDATNVIESPICSIITPIGIDHTDYLGETIEQIAYQKAGIIKEGVPVIVANQCEEAMEVVRQVAKEKCAEVITPHESMDWLEAFIHSKTTKNKCYTPQFIKENLVLSLSAATMALTTIKYYDTVDAFGESYEENTDPAILDELFDKVTDESTDMMMEVIRQYGTEITQVSGRFEQQTYKSGGNKYRLIFDVAHNPHGGAMLRSTIDNYSITYNPRKIYIIVGMFADKDAVGYFKALGGQFEGVKAHYIVTQNSSPRALRADELAVALCSALGGDVAGHTVTDTVGEALDYALDNATSDDIILITGSFTTVSDAKQYIA